MSHVTHGYFQSTRLESMNNEPVNNCNLNIVFK